MTLEPNPKENKTTPKTNLSLPQQIKPKPIKNTNFRRIYCNLCEKKFNKKARYKTHVATIYMEKSTLSLVNKETPPIQKE